MADSRRLVLLVQLPIPPFGVQAVQGNVPLAAGYLKLYADLLGFDRDYRIELLPAADANRLGDQGLLARIAATRPWMVGFTCYLWNIDRTLWLAERLKQECPAVNIVLGGPEVTLDNHRVLDAACVDYAVIGEGEQTFAELLGALQSGTGVTRAIDGLIVPAAGHAHFQPRAPMADLDAISSPYLAGILAPDEEQAMMLETVRGCRYRCKFCYYPKSYTGQHTLSAAKVAANLAYAREMGVREVVLLDPTLNQRPDFLEFVRLLARGNPDRQFVYSAELRAEGIDAATAQLLKDANFSEVEIGLQSVDPRTQQLMGRRVELDAFVDGVHALNDAGIVTRVDLILGLPGDTVDSIRRGIDFLISRRAYREIQVFNLSILPGTAFRREAESLGLVYQDLPPYGVLQTPTLSLVEMASLMEEAQDAFGVDFDAIPPPKLTFGGDDCGSTAVERIDLDLPLQATIEPRHPSLAFTLWLRSADFVATRRAASQRISSVLEANPHLTLQVVLEPTGGTAGLVDVVLPELHAACYRSVSYLDRYYSLQPGSLLGAKRLVVLLPASARSALGAEQIAAIGEFAVIVWRGNTPPVEELDVHEYVERDL